jgi:transcriptional regulator with XRE-family HTH domain
MGYIARRTSVLKPEKTRLDIRARGFTLDEFAKVAGVSRKTLGDWLGGRRTCQLATELKIVRALWDYPRVIPESFDNPWPVPLPKSALEAIGRPARLTRGEPPPTRRPALGAYSTALATVPPWEAWQTYGYRLVPSGRAGAAFRRYLEEGKPWLAFPDVFPDEAAWRLAAPMTGWS